MLKNAFLIILVFVFALCIFLLANLPASIAWKYVIEPNTHARSAGVIPKSFAGTIWNGRAHLSFRHIEGVLSWDMKAGGLISGSLPIDLELATTAGDLDAGLDLGPTRQTLNVRQLQIQLRQLNPFLRAQRVKADGEVFAKSLDLELQDQTIETVSGRFNWTGGAVSYPAGRQIRERTLPPFSGSLQTDADGQLSIGIRDQDASFDTMKGSWNLDGVALWEVTRRVLDIAGEPWAENSSETDVVFKVKKTIPRKLVP